MAAKLFFHANHPRPSLLLDHKSTPPEHAGLTSTVHLHRRVPRISTSARRDKDNGTTNSDFSSSPTPPDESSPSLSSPSTGSDPSRPAVLIRYRSRAEKKRQRKRPEAPPPPPPPPKTWDEMTLGEKAVEMYMGEKGMLFWLNKFAYASIFIVIGGWILFRFVGPALNLYQLDAAPLPPSDLLKSSKP